MKIFLATWLSEIAQERSLTKKKANSRLISYHFVNKAKSTDEQLKNYCEQDCLNPNEEIAENKNNITDMKKESNNQKMRGPHGVSSYFHESEELDPETTVGQTLYQSASWLSETTIFDLDVLSTNVKLEHLAKEINVRIRITQQEIFKIGELLHKAKLICRQEAIHFKDWISDNFDFSYETANNFMNVFQYSLGSRNITLQIPISILYKICSPSFPDELRSYLFNEGNLDRLTNKEFTNLMQKFKEGGIEAIEKDIDEFNRGHIIWRQMNYTFDVVENALKNLENLKIKIECRGGSIRNSYIAFKDQCDSLQPEAREINMKLYNALLSAIATIDTALDESRTLSNQFAEKVLESVNIP